MTTELKQKPTTTTKASTHNVIKMQKSVEKKTNVKPFVWLLLFNNYIYIILRKREREVDFFLFLTF